MCRQQVAKSDWDTCKNWSQGHRQCFSIIVITACHRVPKVLALAAQAEASSVLGRLKVPSRDSSGLPSYSVCEAGAIRKQ